MKLILTLIWLLLKRSSLVVSSIQASSKISLSLLSLIAKIYHSRALIPDVKEPFLVSLFASIPPEASTHCFYFCRWWSRIMEDTRSSFSWVFDEISVRLFISFMTSWNKVIKKVFPLLFAGRWFESHACIMADVKLMMFMEFSLLIFCSLMNAGDFKKEAEESPSVIIISGFHLRFWYNY